MDDTLVGKVAISENLRKKLFSKDFGTGIFKLFTYNIVIALFTLSKVLRGVHFYKPFNTIGLFGHSNRGYPNIRVFKRNQH